MERHIRLLDQAIKEQEASLSQETSRSSFGTGVILPELAVPEWPRKSHNATPIEIVDGLDGDQSTSAQKKTMNGLAEGKDDGGNDSASLVITIPPHPVEELYCYCNRISFGEVSNLHWFLDY